MLTNWLLSRLVVLLSCLFALVAGGCTSESDPERRIVTGRVTFQGKTIPSGEIRFIPLGKGPVSAGRINNGTFEVSHRGGVVIGEAQVKIVATTSDAGISQDELDQGGMQQKAVSIPQKYNQKSVLRAKVTPGKGKQTIDFDLTKISALSGSLFKSLNTNLPCYS